MSPQVTENLAHSSYPDRRRGQDCQEYVDGQKQNKKGSLDMKQLLIVAISVTVLLGFGKAFAGEVKGPPGQIDNVNETGAPEHANSNCAFSGLNDFDSNDQVGQQESQVQTAADSFKFYGMPHGVEGRIFSEPIIPGTDVYGGLCRGGTNRDRGE